MIIGEENEEEEEEEEEGSSNYEEDGIDFYEDVGESVFRMLPSSERDVSNVVMIQHNFGNEGSDHPAAPTGSRQGLTWGGNMPLPLGSFEEPSSVSASNGRF